MATWLTHIRIAEKVKERIPGISLPYLMMGSIAPDSGIPDESCQAYNPPKEITHFSTKLVENESKIDLEAFFEKYLAPSKIITRSDRTRSFLWGYYFHLIADSIWINKYMLPCKKEYEAEDHQDKDFIDFMREEIYALDFLYLQNHGKELLEKFKNISVEVNYISEIEPSYIYECQKKIVNYYENEQYVLTRPYRFYSAIKIDAFINEVAQACIEVLL